MLDYRIAFSNVEIEDEEAKKKFATIFTFSNGISNLVAAIGNCILITYGCLKSYVDEFYICEHEEGKTFVKVGRAPNLFLIFSKSTSKSEKSRKIVFSKIDDLMIFIEIFSTRFLDLLTNSHVTKEIVTRLLKKIGNYCNTDNEFYNEVKRIEHFLDPEDKATKEFNQIIQEFDLRNEIVEKLKNFFMMNKEQLIIFAKLLVMNKLFSYNYTIYKRNFKENK